MSEKNKLTISVDGSGADQIGPGPESRIKPAEEHRPGGGVDLVFVIDTTGSMSDKIDGLLATCTRFVQEFAALKLDHRIAVMAFGDLKVPGDGIQVTGFTNKIETTTGSLKRIPRYSGGGNEGESSLEALVKAMHLQYRPNVVKALILLTDEPAHQYQVKARDVIREMGAREFLVFTVTPPYGYFKEMAEKNGGKWYKIAANTDFTDLLKMFQQIAVKVSQTVSDVYRLGDGRVSSYMKLKPPEK